MDDALESDRQAGCAHPRETYRLEGHEDAEHAIASAIESGRLHHAWLITGPRGVGKATLAYRFARRILGAAPDHGYGLLGASPDDPVSHRIEVQSHSDLLVLRRPADKAGKSLKSVITVEEARKAPSFFTRSSGEGGWRVVIVDSADELQHPAASNALLKTLEEPPGRGLLILISHAPGRLLPTIRSRCRRLDLRALDSEAALIAARRQVEMSDDEAALIARMSEGAPGRAVSLAAAGGAKLHRELNGIFEQLPRLDAVQAHKLSDRLSLKNEDAALRLFHRLTLRYAEERARGAMGAEQPALFGEPRRTGAPKAWLNAWEKLGRARREQEALYLDPKAGVMNALMTLRDAADA